MATKSTELQPSYEVNIIATVAENTVCFHFYDPAVSVSGGTSFELIADSCRHDETCRFLCSSPRPVHETFERLAVAGCQIRVEKPVNGGHEASECVASEKVTFPFRSQEGSLSEQWYPVGFSNDLKPNQTMRQVVLGVPVLVWRIEAGTLHGFVDICPHRHAQLSRGVADELGLTCPYHGWRFGSDGQCNHIPVSLPDNTPNDRISLTSIPTCEHGGIIWSWLGDPSSVAAPPQELDGYEQSAGWRMTRAARVFPFDLDDVVENFMDFAHTPIVHPGLIRGISSAKERGVTIEIGETTVKAVHDPVDEKVGLLSGLVVPRGKLVQHSDTFSLPGNVKVEYWFGNDEPKFFAFLGMTPVSANETLILITIGVRFGWLNPLISLALPRLIRRVLDQDERILAEQRGNLDLVSNLSRRSLQSDAVDATVRAMRAHVRDPAKPRPQPGNRRIHVRV